MRWLEELDDVILRWFFFYFIGSFLLGNNRSMLTCRLLAAMKVVSIIEAYDWGQNGQIPLFWKYLGIYHFFRT